MAGIKPEKCPFTSRVNWKSCGRITRPVSVTTCGDEAITAPVAGVPSLRRYVPLIGTSVHVDGKVIAGLPR